MQSGNVEGKPGYEKILKSCTQATADGYKYIWADTCCIDKRSSAELSEAINSMYSWYKEAEICYAYLADVSADADSESSSSAFVGSRWFTRGWTLQELIAPSKVVFFSSDWVPIGEKSSLKTLVSERTGIDVDILVGLMSPESASVAKRMSWASCRTTSRKEDMAYCLMGLFSINMPMLYGEGEKAFVRLQEEIMKDSDDQSLFAWTDLSAPENAFTGLLAEHPKHFRHCGKVVSFREWETVVDPYSMTNRGLRIGLHLSHYENDIYIAALSCTAPWPHEDTYIGIYLKRDYEEDKQYLRVKPQSLHRLDAQGRIETIYVRQKFLHLRLTRPPRPPDYSSLAFQLGYVPEGHPIRHHVTCPAHVRLRPVQPVDYEQPHGVRLARPLIFRIRSGANRLAGAFYLSYSNSRTLLVMLGSTSDHGIGYDVVESANYEAFEEIERRYNPHATGTIMHIENCQVCVTAEPQVYLRTKYFLIDVKLRAIVFPT